MVIVILIAFLVLAISIDAIIRYNKNRKPAEAATLAETYRAFNESSVATPKGIFYDKGHTWAFMEQNGQVKVGLDDFLLQVTGPISKVKLKAEGEKVEKGEELLTIIQDGKQLTINSPVSGTVSAPNQSLLADSSMLNSSPYYAGWVYKIEPENWERESQFLLVMDKYRTWLDKEFTRLKDFFAVSVQNLMPQPVAVLQDGGELQEQILSEMGPEVWEEFQHSFLNAAK